MLTRLLIAVNLVVYGFEIAKGGLAWAFGNAVADPSIVANGALLGTDVLHGEWWRIFTAAFLHGPLQHIAFNMLALWQVGSVVEALYGTPRMGVLYVLSALGSGLLVTYWQPSVETIGASGAIFGLFGALVAAGMQLGARGRQLVQQSIGIIILNLAIGFTIPNISNAGHIGGLIAGFFSGAALFRRPRPQPVYAPAEVDLHDAPGVLTIEQRAEPADEERKV